MEANRADNRPVLDILIAVAEKGGVENCINMLGRYLCDKGIRVRIIQMVYEGVSWADECMEFHYVYSSRQGRNIQEFIDGYANFLNTEGVPNLSLATAWPMMSYVSKKATGALGINLLTASWLHAPIGRYEAAGFGGADFLKAADIHFAISDEIAKQIRKADPESYIYRIYNPADLSKVRKTDIGKPGTLLFVGRLSEEKNIGVIIRAIASANTDWKLRLAGDGKEKEKLEKLAAGLNVSSKLEFEGWSDDPWKYAEGAYAFVISSVYEGSPLAAIEALSCGLPVIGNVSSGVAELVRPGINGYLYHDEDHKELAMILDYIADGKFPVIDSETCRKSVAKYDSSVSLLDFHLKLLSCMAGKLLEDRLYK
ncbi:MAG: glycosyltransferase [Lachnospiraceae bacterium]|nr:glycosyltransferase [Lachnospiraceae bacterium]